MTSEPLPFYRSLESLGEVVGDPLPVTLSPELVGLLSEQLYRSPSKAIEELVVNGFDADASEARVFVPPLVSDTPIIVVYDDGSGMTYEGLADLWKIGRAKQRDGSLGRHKERKQIGKFGIGKLATYTIANSVTYVTKTSDEHLGVTIDYRQFTSDQSATPTQIRLKVHRTGSIDPLWTEERFRAAVESIGLDVNQLTEQASWTIVILEDLKEKARAMQPGRLKWVLRTAMPLSTQFSLFLNKERVESSKEDYEKVVEFNVHELPEHRVESINKTTDDEWRIENEQLVAPSFPSGISGKVTVTRQSLIGKSDDIVRSYGFFVYIRGRLINEEDALFGLKNPLQLRVWNRFRADISVDDLDEVLTANREAIEKGQLQDNVQKVLNELFYEARHRYDDWEKAQVVRPTQEDTQKWVPERLAEHPTADALTRYSHGFKGTEADESWMYLNVNSSTDIKELTASLYASTGRKDSHTFRFSARGKASRLVRYDPLDSIFTINMDHELVLAYQGDPGAQSLLRHVAASEALLEVYLREANVDPHVIGEVLEKRDLLLRGLADSRMHSLPALSDYIRRNATEPVHFEIGLVAGVRALGFVAKHIGGPGQPDGIARFTDFPDGEQIITLEAKSSSGGAPPAKDIDFAALKLHMDQNNAAGCLLVAPSYQGNEEGNSAASANNLKISCWTADQFAAVVEVAESRQISARQILEIVKNRFSPSDVTDAVNLLLSAPSWKPRELYIAIVQAIKDAHNMLSGSRRTVQIIATLVAQMEGFADIQEGEVEKAVRDLAGSSQGALLLPDGATIVLNVDYDELDRRVQMLTGVEGRPRRMGSFGEVSESPEEQSTE